MDLDDQGAAVAIGHGNGYLFFWMLFSKAYRQRRSLRQYTNPLYATLHVYTWTGNGKWDPSLHRLIGPPPPPPPIRAAYSGTETASYSSYVLVFWQQLDRTRWQPVMGWPGILSPSVQWVDETTPGDGLTKLPRPSSMLTFGPSFTLPWRCKIHQFR
jgi:hypothetical protein